jgi:hypothetical protein
VVDREEIADAPELVTDGTAEIPESEEAERALAALLDERFPLHGLVTGLQLHVRDAPEPDAATVGWLRIGNRVRLGREAIATPTCASGWHEVYPQGFACAGQGIEVDAAPPDAELAVSPPPRDAALPYSYWTAKEPMTPEYHRLPSRDEQRAAATFTQRYMELHALDQRRAARMLSGELPNEPPKPAVVHRFLDRGFMVAGVGVEMRASRNFVRTGRGRFVRQVELMERTGSAFQGVTLDDEVALPIVWASREAAYRTRVERDDGVRFPIDAELAPIPRHALVSGWQRRANIDDQVVHVLETPKGPRYVRDWFLSVAAEVDRPRGVADDEPWVHIDLSEQTLVVYVGDAPRFATLVSTGEEGFETPAGLFEIRRKYIADTMANIGDGNDERYSIEDVPWTQYFDGSIALHGAFWHSRFGLPRSHGCVNLAPRDARVVFDALWPRVPDGWLGVSAEQGAFRASHVLVTD